MKMEIRNVNLFVVRKKGSLLVEAIFTLWILVLSFLLIESLFLVLTKGETVLQNHQVRPDFELFIAALELELYQSNFSALQVQGKRFWFTNQYGERVSYEWSGGRIRRKVNGMGNDIVLMNVRDFQVQRDGFYNRLTIEVEFNDKETQQAEISYITS